MEISIEDMFISTNVCMYKFLVTCNASNLRCVLFTALLIDKIRSVDTSVAINPLQCSKTCVRTYDVFMAR